MSPSATCPGAPPARPFSKSAKTTSSCFGGIVAYEVASQLQAMGESVAAVIVIAAVLPTAIQVDWGKRLMGLALGAWKRPGTFSHKLRERLDQLCARSSLRGIFQGRKQLEQASHAVDLDINGPEADTAAKMLTDIEKQREEQAKAAAAK